MQRACDSCGGKYEAKTARSRFCGERCRKRAQRTRPDAVVRQLPVKGAKRGSRKAPKGSEQVAAPASPKPVEGPVLVSTRKTLEDAGRLDTPMGQAAMVLAARLDFCLRDTGSAVASLARELRSTLDAATAGANRVGSPTDRMRDELRERREAKSGA